MVKISKGMMTSIVFFFSFLMLFIITVYFLYFISQAKADQPQPQEVYRILSNRWFR